MAVELAQVVSVVEKAAATVFGADPSIRSLGVGRTSDGFGFVAVRNTKAPVPYGLKFGLNAPPIPDEFNGIPIHFVNSAADPRSLARVPHSGPASPGVGSLIPEQQLHRPLVCGMQIQNFDQDVRSGEIAKGYIIIGTLGCFIRVPSGDVAILSNNHVVGGENSGQVNQDRILQPGNSAFDPQMHVAVLSDFVQLSPSPNGASVAAGTAVLNEVDAGCASLNSDIQYLQSYLPGRTVNPPKGTVNPSVGDKVHKVGRTTGLTFGTVKQISVVVGPIPYTPGECWFRQSIVIEGDNGTTFSDHGDSGSGIVRDDGMLVGLLYAGNGTQTYACAIDNVFRLLNCTLI